MTTRRSFIKKSLAAGISLAAMGTAAPVSAVAASAKRSNKRKTAKRVLVLSFDGICIEGFKTANIPNIRSLMQQGCASLTTRDVMPSNTLPNYSSIFMGAGPEVHGITFNGWRVDNYKIPAIVRDEEGYFPSLFGLLKDHGIKTAFYWNWKPLINPYNPRVFDDTFYAADDAYDELYDHAFEFMKEHRDEPSMIFLYSVHTDHAGHHFDWMSPEYIAAIEEGDARIGKLLQEMKDEGLYEDTHFMFISDHGGKGNGHGGVSEAEMIVPWVIAGPGIKKDFLIEEPNNTVNTASTIATLFGVEQPLCWTGEVPQSIFE